MTAGKRPARDGVPTTIDPVERMRRAHDAVRAAVRRESGEEKPLGPKAKRTRQALIEVAEQLFEEVGYEAASPSLIAERAGVSLGTFYQYFPDLNGIIAVLAGERVAEILSRHGDYWDPLSGRLGLRRSIAVFVDIYFENPSFYRIWGRVSHADDRISELRRSFWAAYKQRFEEDLRDGVALGVVRSDLDPAAMARALTLMTESYCYDVTLFDPPTPAITADQAIDTLTSLWADAIGLIEPSTLRRSPDFRAARNQSAAPTQTTSANTSSPAGQGE